MGDTGGVAIGASPPCKIGALSPYKRHDLLARYWPFPFLAERRGLANRKCARPEAISLSATERQFHTLVAEDGLCCENNRHAVACQNPYELGLAARPG